MKMWVILGMILVSTGLFGQEKLRHQWDLLTEQMDRVLISHEKTIKELQSQIEAAIGQNDEMSLLLVQMQIQNDSLIIMNDQIGERMQQRDEELWNVYKELDALAMQRLFLLIWAVPTTFCTGFFIAGLILRRRK